MALPFAYNARHVHILFNDFQLLFVSAGGGNIESIRCLHAIRGVCVRSVIFAPSIFFYNENSPVYIAIKFKHHVTMFAPFNIHCLFSWKFFFFVKIYSFSFNHRLFSFFFFFFFLSSSIDQVRRKFFAPPRKSIVFSSSVQ